MKVIWKGSIELQSGIEKITLEAPSGTEDELYEIRKAVKKGKEIELRIRDTEIPAYRFDNLVPVMSMIQDQIDKAYERGKSDCKEEEKENLC